MKTCKECGSIIENVCIDCPGVDSQKYCDHRCVGAIIRNNTGDILMFERNTFPNGTPEAPVIAGPAGHLDGDPSWVALKKEVWEEVGLRVYQFREIDRFWESARCRRRYAMASGHFWTFYEAEVIEGDLKPSERETKNVRWYTPSEVQRLIQNTARYLQGVQVPHLDIPWYSFLSNNL